MKNIIKNTNKKGFTIVELVIVIAVIAILAGVLIPTFANVIENANMSAVKQDAVNKYKECYALDLEDGVLDGYEGPKTDGKQIEANNYTVTDDNGVVTVTYEHTDKGYTVTVENGVAGDVGPAGQ